MSVWVKSARSTAEGDNCVEVVAIEDGVLIRNSKTPDGPVIQYTRGEWDAFLDGAHQGEFDWNRLRSLGYGLGYGALPSAI